MKGEQKMKLGSADQSSGEIDGEKNIKKAGKVMYFCSFFFSPGPWYLVNLGYFFQAWVDSREGR